MKNNACKRVFDRLRSYRAVIKQKPTSMDQESIKDLLAIQRVSRWIEEAVEILSRRNPKTSMDRDCDNFCQEKIEGLDRNESIEKLSSLIKTIFQRKEKHTEKNSIKQATQPKIQTTC